MSALGPEDVVIKLLEIVGIEKEHLNADQLEALQDLAVSQGWVSDTEPQDRMRTTMNAAAEAIGVQWKHDPPADHPYGAKLDGMLLRGGEQIAVVELEAIDAKHARAALLDLLTYPCRRKLLVLGRSKRATGCDSPARLREDFDKNVLPAVGRVLANEPDVGIFTELQLRSNPDILKRFLKGL